MTNSRTIYECQERSKIWAATANLGTAQDDRFNQMIIAEAPTKPSEDVLGIATGGGNPAVSTALSMDCHGSITCTDVTPATLQSTRGRAENLSLPIMRFAAADMGACHFRIISSTASPVGLASFSPTIRSARLPRPGGCISYVVCGPYEGNPTFYVRGAPWRPILESRRNRRRRAIP